MGVNGFYDLTLADATDETGKEKKQDNKGKLASRKRFLQENSWILFFFKGGYV